MKNAVQQQRRRQQSNKEISSMEEKTIAELWKQLQYDCEHAGDLRSDGHKGEFERVLKNDIEPLRAELLKRCENGIEDKDGDVAEIWGNNRSSIVVQSAHTVLDFSIEQARDFSAAIAFLAWEMEQREKEVQDV